MLANDPSSSRRSYHEISFSILADRNHTDSLKVVAIYCPRRMRSAHTLENDNLQVHCLPLSRERTRLACRKNSLPQNTRNRIQECYVTSVPMLNSGVVQCISELLLRLFRELSMWTANRAITSPLTAKGKPGRSVTMMGDLLLL